MGDDPNTLREVARCEDCRFWDNSVQAQNVEPDTTGACRRNAPRMDKRTGLALWPFSEDTDWCGEFTAAIKEGQDAE